MIIKGIISLEFASARNFCLVRPIAIGYITGRVLCIDGGRGI
jgi:hypothetical protein